MRIQVNSDKNIAVDAEFTRFVRGEVNRALERFKAKLTRVEIHLSDVNSFKFGKQDKRCMAEARPAGHRPLVAIMSSANIDSAVKGSLNKLRNALETFFARTKRIPKSVRRPAPRTPERGAAKVATTKRYSARKRSSAGARKSAKRTYSKNMSATASAADHPPQGGRSPKKKGIYQARRKGWPRR